MVNNLIPRFPLLPVERPWLGLVICLSESGKLKTNNLGEVQIGARFVSAEGRWKVQPRNCVPDLGLKVMTS